MFNMHYTFYTSRSSKHLLLFLFFLFIYTGSFAQNPTVSLSGGPCTGSTLTATSSITPTQVIWNVNGSPVSTGTSLTYVANTAGSYTATINTANGSATTSAVVITALTTPTIVISSIPSSTTICAGTNVSLNATATFTGNTPTYQWKKNGTIVGTNSSTYTVNTLANGDVINCTLTSSDACASPTTASSNNITYTINTPVTPSVSITSSSTNICSGASVLFIAAPVNGGPTPAYEWYVNGNLVNNATTDSFTTTTLTSGSTVYCKMVSSAPCPTVETVTSNTITMTVSTSVTPAVNIVPSPSDTICVGTPVIFSANTSNGGSNPQYQWYMNGTAISGATSTSYSSSSLVTNDIISFKLISNATCATVDTVSSNSITMVVNPIGTPSVTIAPQNNDTITCVNDTVTFTATPVFGGTAPLYTWKKNSAVLASLSTQNSIAVTGLNNHDTVRCILTSSQPCATVATANSNAVVMTVNPFVTLTLSISANPGASITAGQVVIFTATVTNAGPSFNYQWYINNVAQAGSISPTFSSSTLANGDIVTCKVTTAEQCATNPTVTSNAITMQVANGVSVISNPDVQVGLYPNPNNGDFKIEGNINNDVKEVALEITNLLGQVVYRNTIPVHNGKVNQQVALQHVPGGLYQLKIKAGEALEVLKFVLDK